MLIALKRLDGKLIYIDSSTIFRVRPAIKSMEPKAVSVVHYDPDPSDSRYETLASNETIAAVVKTLGKVLPMAKLTSPSGTAVYVDAAKVMSVSPANKDLHYPGAEAILFVHKQTQQVSETPDEAGAIINAARIAAPATTGRGKAVA